MMQAVEPVVRDTPGGWLAVTPPSYPLRIGVMEPSEQEARDHFAVALQEWRELLDDVPQTDDGAPAVVAGAP